MTGPGKRHSEIDALRALSAHVGADPFLTQGAGGNTSVKIDETLWIKASGTWLADAMTKDILVPVEMAPLLNAVEAIDPAAEQAQQFVPSHLNPTGLRPSIETTVHALMPQRVVVHVHCVDTIALAVRTDCVAEVGARLAGLNWSFIPYARPGLPLALAIAENRKPESDVLILGNHGLVVAADTVTAAEHLLYDVKARLSLPCRQSPAPDLAALASRISGSSYRPPIDEQAHAVALDPISLTIAAKGSLYPDHVVFLGKGSVVAGEGETADAVCSRLGASPAAILFPGVGVAMRTDVPKGADAMARCLADVCARIPEHAPLRLLSDIEHDQLTNWDAEKYRQELARAAARKSA